MCFGVGLVVVTSDFLSPVGHLGSIPITFKKYVPLVQGRVCSPANALGIGFATNIVKLSIKAIRAAIRKQDPFDLFIPSP